MRTSARFSVALALAAAPAPAPAQAYVTGRTPSARVDRIFAAYDRDDAPGCAVGVIEGGKLTYARGYGSAQLEHGVRITPSTTFYLASTAKQFTAYSVLLLERDGKLALDDDVRRYIPELAPFADPITIRQLLHHTSGLRDYFGLFALRGWQYDELLTPEELLTLVARQRTLNFVPGQHHLYSNTGYALLALVVQRVSGRSLRDFADERIFRPLGMSSTQFRDDHRRLVRRRAAGYDRTSAGFEQSEPAFDVVGDGGLFSTVEDLARWDANFYEPKVGDRATLARLLQRGVLASGDTIFYAAGVGHGTYRGAQTLSHPGAYAGYRAELMRFPTYGLSVAVLCNRGDANPTLLAEQVADVYLGDALTDDAPVRVTNVSASASLDRRAVSRLAGLYWSEDDESVFRIVAGDGALRVGTSDPLQPVAPLVFAVAGTPTRYRFDTTSTPSAVVVSRFGLPDQRFEVVDSATADAQTIDHLLGRYRSDEIGVQMTVQLTEGKPSVRWTGTRETPLTPLFGNTFVADGGLIVRFAPRDSLLTISNGRMQRLTFKRR
jgi:CubicO group peptidase (beta-lactamase class C family)